MSSFAPFSDDATSFGIGEITIENGRDVIAIYGSVNVTRDRVGLAHALKLKGMLDQVVAKLEAVADLPEALPAPDKPATVKNPFS